MAERKGTIVAAPVRIADTEMAVPVAYSNEIYGGTHNYETISQRDAIPAYLRVWGMICTVSNDTDTDKNGVYVLTRGYVNNDLTDNDNWKLLDDAETSVDFVRVEFQEVDDSVIIGWNAGMINRFGGCPTNIVAFKENGGGYEKYEVQWVIDSYPATLVTVWTNGEKGFLIIS